MSYAVIFPKFKMIALSKDRTKLMYKQGAVNIGHRLVITIHWDRRHEILINEPEILQVMMVILICNTIIQCYNGISNAGNI